MEANEDDWDNHHVGKADQQQENGQTIAKVSIYVALSLILDINGRHIQESQLGTIDRC